MLNPSPPTNLTWFSRINSTQTGSPVLGTGFDYSVNNSTSVPTSQTVSWNLTIPKPLSGATTFVRFQWNGTLGSNTRARYMLLNGSDPITGFGKNIAGPTSFGGPPMNSTGGIPLTCRSMDECLVVSPKYVGFNLTLVFTFTTNSTSGGLKVQVRNIMVASAAASPVTAFSHSMGLRPGFPSFVDHVGKNSLTYSANVTYPRPNTSPTQNMNHTWSNMLLTFFIPANYTVGTIDLNGTAIYPTPYPLFRGPCNTQFCTNSQFVSLNMTSPNDRGVNMIATTTATTRNAVTSVEPSLNASPTSFWMPGDTMGVKMTTQPGVNVSGSHIVAVTDAMQTSILNKTFTNKGGTYDYEVTLASLANLGMGNLTGVFLSGYDYGRLIHPIRLEEIRTTSLSIIGNAGQGATLTVQGSFAYISNSSAAQGVNATVFVVDAGSFPGPVTAPGNPSGGLYISNITLANGVFTQGQPLILFFTITNPSPSSAFNASLTLDHEWFSGTGGGHGATTAIPLTLGDEPFTLSRSSVYKLDATFTSTGVQVTIRSVRTGNQVAKTLSIGSSGVPSSRQHFGSFRISVTSKPVSGGTETTSTLTSPTYAYVLQSVLLPSKLLAVSSAVTSSASGSFTTTVLGDKILGAKRLAVFALARDLNGIVLGRDRIVPVADSTALTPSAIVPGEVSIKQSVQVTLKLVSNSSTLPITLTLILDLSGSGTVSTKTVTIQPRTTLSTAFDFTAPSNAGSYLLTFYSPQYPAPLSTETLQVVLLQSSLQIIVPAIVALVAAMVILGLYLVRRGPGTGAEEQEKPRPAPSRPKPQTGPSGSKPLTRS